MLCGQQSPVVLKLKEIQPAELRNSACVPDTIESGERRTLVECPLQ